MTTRVEPLTASGSMSRIILPDGFAGLEQHAECPVCADFLIGVIRMCTRGHSICEKCIQVVSLCPLCRKEMSQVRNYFMEFFMDSCSFKCKYFDQGCNAELRPSEYNTHTSRCHFREVSCSLVTYDACEAILNFKDYISHLKLRHKIREFTNGMDYCFRFPRDVGKIYQSPYAYIEFDGKLFFYNFATYPLRSVAGKEITIGVWWVSVINVDNDCSKYTAEIQIASRKDKSLKMSWSGAVFDFRLTAEEVLVEKQCLSATLPALKQYCTDDGKDGTFFFSYVESATICKTTEMGPLTLTELKEPIILSTDESRVES